MITIWTASTPVVTGFPLGLILPLALKQRILVTTRIPSLFPENELLPYYKNKLLFLSIYCVGLAPY